MLQDMKQMRIHIWAFLVCVALLFAVLPTSVGAAELASGSCGSRLTWSLDNQGTLTISGTGAMYDAPWRDEHSAVVKKVVIQQGVTNIDDWAFYNCSNLSSISIPNSVTSIGELAFDGCSSLRSISIPDSVTSIGK